MSDQQRQNANTEKEQNINDIDGTPGDEVAGPSTATQRIRALNDQLRCHGLGGRTFLTPGVTSQSSEQQAEIIRAVRRFDRFNERNDPYGEHDCALINVAGLNVLWKIDAYDTTLTLGSPDPADPDVTCRVLTIMLADEY